MNCQPCAEQDHAHCVDIYWGPPLDSGHHAPSLINLRPGVTEADDWHLKPGRLYRSCFCQHKVSVAAEPATGPAGE